MTMKRLSLLAAASAASLMALSGCASNFRADVSRFQQLPPPSQGQTFTVQAENPQLAGGLEFGHYAQLVTERMVAQGYQPASDPATAQLIVRMDYGVDRGRERIRSSGFSGGWGGFGGPGWGAWGPGYGRGWGPAWGGWRGRYAYGFYDPFLWGPGPGFNDVSSYTVYGSQLRLRIDKAGGGRVFEGTARAQSVSNKLTYLVPNLIDAMFTGFPGNNGEEIKVTVAPEPKKD
ncbi:DUF4136 domain-containing protein [Sphingobium sp. CR28]|uniref:DUF4136 domain-containing protein n=1 Tax=Sphingobium sp. CR28 TaxID=3400272 RepID=UPI003FED8AD7